ncbi:MAG: adenosylhomocysteinase [Peptococcaceae bacterium]|jgi:adenosylhomocysteinase|nr:adenosylhomocysteinase [Peptococcaceae bacterium]
MGDSWIRDPGLAPSGRDKIQWVWRNMPVMRQIAGEFAAAKPFAGMRILVCLHLEAKTACLGLTLREGGATVTMTASNPLSTQDDVCAAMVADGLRVFALHGATPEEYSQCHRRALEDGLPELFVDDGGDITALLHKSYRQQLSGVLGGSEETTTGIQRLKAMEKDGTLQIPMLAVNDARMKYLFDNRYGTGQSAWDAIMNATNLVIAGKTAVVVGYGWCGKGVAMRARGLGARVIVTEVDPVKAIEAWMDGFQVMTMAEAAPLGDYFITVTGVNSVINGAHMAKMRDGAILANAGHFDAEISKPDLAAWGAGPKRVKPHIDAYESKDGRRLYLIGEGRLVNLAAGNGHPAEVMDTSFAAQALAMLYLRENQGSLPKKVIPVPAALDERIARIKLAAANIGVDSLTAEQKAYQESWVIA